MRKFRGLAGLGSASLVAMALVLAPAVAQSSSRSKARPAMSFGARPIGSFTPAVSDPRLAATLARRGTLQLP